MVHVALPEDHIRPLRRSEYDRLVDAGVFDKERLELLYGRLVRMSPQGEPHSLVIERLTRLFIVKLGDRARVRVQLPIVAPDESEPEPDLAVVPLGGDPGVRPHQAHLIIEVAESSLSIDRDVKSKLYAAMNVPEYWIVNLVECAIEVFTDPKDGEYRDIARKDRDAKLKLHAFSDVELDASEILPL